MGASARGLITALPALLTASLVAGGCGASAARHPDEGVPAEVVQARRVLSLLESRHVDGGALDAARARVAFERLLELADPEQACGPRREELEPMRDGMEEALRDGDAGFAQALVLRCHGEAADPERARALLFDALARSFDPHSAYLPPRAAATRRTALAGTDADAQPAPGGDDAGADAGTGAEPAPIARGRIVEHAGQPIGHLVLPAFYLHADGRSAGRDVAHLVRTLSERGARVLVLDLRGNGGGVMAEAARVMAALSGPAPLGYSVAADGEPVALGGGGARPAFEGPLVVWVDAGTASAAELLAAALQDAGRALVVGRQTHGKGSVQTLIWLASPLGARVAAMQITTARMYRVDGDGLQQRGVTPDVTLGAPQPDAGITERERAGALPWNRIDVGGARHAQRPQGDLLTDVRRAAASAHGDEAVWEVALRWARSR